MMSIESIERFYNLNSEKKLINIILDRKESAKLLGGRTSSQLTSETGDECFES